MEKYYRVNTDLALETCRKARDAGVGQFILMSSMIIYGDGLLWGRERVIDEHTVPEPGNFYGDSKWQADSGVRKMQFPGGRASAAHDLWEGKQRKLSAPGKTGQTSSCVSESGKPQIHAVY